MQKGLQQDNIYLDNGCIERGAMGVKCLAKEHNTLTQPCLTSGPPDTESSAGLCNSQLVESP